MSEKKPTETEEDLIINEILGWERWCDGGHVTRDEIKRMMKQQKPTVTREWVHYFCAYINAGHKSPADDFDRVEHAIKKLTEIGAEVVE